MASMISEEDEDELWRLLKPGVRQAGLTQSPPSIVKSRTDEEKEPLSKGKLGRAQKRVENLEREHSALSVEALNESDEQALERILQLSEISSQLEIAKKEMESLTANTTEQDLKDRLAMTNTAMMARSGSDQSHVPLFNVRAPLFHSHEESNQEYIVDGVPLPPGITRPKDEMEHERIVRVARHAVSDVSLLTSLLQEKGLDPRFGFLKSFHPLNEYFQCFLSMAPEYLDSLIDVAVKTKEMNQPINVSELNLETETDESVISNVIGQAIYPKFHFWFGEDLAPKLVGMMISLPKDQTIPLLSDMKALKEAGSSALAAFKQSESS